MGLGLGGQGAGQIGFTLGVQGVIGAPRLGNKEGRSIGLNAGTCSYVGDGCYYSERTCTPCSQIFRCKSLYSNSTATYNLYIGV